MSKVYLWLRFLQIMERIGITLDIENIFNKIYVLTL